MRGKWRRDHRGPRGRGGRHDNRRRTEAINDSTIHVSTEHPYDIIVRDGALEHLSEIMPSVAPGFRYAVVTDSNVTALHAGTVALGLADCGKVSVLEFPAGESYKTRETWAQLSDTMLDEGFGRDSVVIGVGGGVVGDVAGFLAATYMRGLPVVHIPTTLLAMIDSSIGGKTGVDTPAGKNLVGAFHQPAAVIADPLVLTTLPTEQISNGLAEALKHGAISDRSYFDRVADLGSRPSGEAAGSIVVESVRIKAEVVSADERESGYRAVLNFGHTVGHAVELLTDFSLPHGHAVGIGMVVSAVIGEHVGVTEPGTAGQLRDALEKLGLPTAIPAECDGTAVVESMLTDKKNREGKIYMTLIERVGKVARPDVSAWTHPIDAATIADCLSEKS